MENPALWFMLLFVAVGLLMAAGSMPLIRRRVKRNPSTDFEPKRR